MTAQERELWELLQAHEGPRKAITQEDAGRRLGLTGGVDTIRRRVQHLRDGILDSGRIVLSTSGGSRKLKTRPGMYLPVSVEQVDAYFDEIRARALSTLQKASRISNTRAARIARDLLTEIGSNGAQDEPAPAGAGEGPLPCTANLRPGERPSDGQPNGRKCAVCERPLAGRQQDYCGDLCKDLFHGRRSPEQLPLLGADDAPKEAPPP